MEKKVYCKVILKETKEVIGILEKPYAKSFSDHPEIFEIREPDDAISKIIKNLFNVVLRKELPKK